MIRGMAHVGLFIKDIEVSKKFYMEKLGFKLECEATMPDGTKVAMIRNNDCRIELVQTLGYKNYHDGFFNHISFEVDDIMDAKKDLESKGIVFETEEPVLMKGIFNDVKYLMFRGKDGEHLEIDEILR